MSHILSAGVYIADSKQWDLTKGDSFFTLSDIIRNIIDGNYADPMLHLESIQLNSLDQFPIKTAIQGITLGDGEIQIFNRGDVEKNIGGKKGKIGVICGLDDQILILDLSEIRSITQEKVHKLIQPEDMIGALMQSQRSFSVQSSDSGLAVSMH
ncbi:hypothetical protein HOO68_02890 [Candidatus Gracilibacteria bacterium]|nr:hypothetical protein [Candidatus Gracilibacteria bacterium]